MADDFQIVWAGDAAVIVMFAERVDPLVNARAIELANRLRASAPGGVQDVVPTFRSVAVYFNPLQTDHNRLLAELHHLAASKAVADAASTEPLQIPVRYGGPFGPDLA